MASFSSRVSHVKNIVLCRGWGGGGVISRSEQAWLSVLLLKTKVEVVGLQLSSAFLFRLFELARFELARFERFQIFGW